MKKACLCNKASIIDNASFFVGAIKRGLAWATPKMKNKIDRTFYFI